MDFGVAGLLFSESGHLALICGGNVTGRDALSPFGLETARGVAGLLQRPVLF